MPAICFQREPPLPSSNSRKIKNLMLFLTFDRNTSNPKLSFEFYKVRNRLINKNQRDFLHVSFHNLNLKEDEESQTTSESSNKRSEYIRSILNDGVEVAGRTYIFCGHSSSQLRSRCCFLKAAANHSIISNEINSLGHFSHMHDVVKRSKRIGLLFSNAEQIFPLKQIHTRVIEDTVREMRNFTDGCGVMSLSYAKEIAAKFYAKNCNHGINQEYIPSVYQIRYQGYKGTLLVVEDWKLRELLEGKISEEDEIKVIFRKSMIKFTYKKESDDELFILDHGKPAVPAKLNGELAMILSTLGVPDEVFLQKLHIYFDYIGSASEDLTLGWDFLHYKCRHLVIKKISDLIEKGKKLPEWVRNEIIVSQINELKSIYDKHDLERVHILIEKSRLLFGVCDPSEELKEGECFIQITTNYKTLTTYTLQGWILVGRNPCLHPGDIQMFRAVDNPALYSLKDCIVFSTKGILPPASQLSGGDLDGDKFFVCWDEDLYPRIHADPLDYTNLPKPTRSIHFRNRRNPQMDLIDYFAKYNNISLGKISSLYHQWIRCNPRRSFSSECRSLNELYSQCVDGANVYIPKNLCQPPVNKGEYPFILDVLTTEIKEILGNRFTSYLNGLHEPLDDANVNRKRKSQSWNKGNPGGGPPAIANTTHQIQNVTPSIEMATNDLPGLPPPKKKKVEAPVPNGVEVDQSIKTILNRFWN